MLPKSIAQHDRPRESPTENPPSPTSTFQYSQEPFETYQHRVLAVVQPLLPNAVAPLAVFRMAGGANSRVTGITARFADGSKDYVYRTPRWLQPVDGEVNVLRYLNQNTSLPTPVVVAERLFPSKEAERDDGDAASSHYSSCEATREEAYILMERLEGVPLREVYYGFTQAQKLDMARKFAKLMADIYAIPVPSAVGYVKVGKDDHLAVSPFLPEQDSIKAGEDGCLALHTADLEDPAQLEVANYLAKHFHNRREAMEKGEPDNILACDDYAKLATAVRTLLEPHSAEFRQAAFAVFHHGDLAARNVLVSPPASPEGFWSITGVLDWDDSLILPAAASFWFPNWLWLESEDAQNIDYLNWEFDADPELLPDTQERADIKSAFVETMEARFPKYMEIVRLGRQAKLKKFFWIAQHGVSALGASLIIEDIFRTAGLPTYFAKLDGGHLLCQADGEETATENPEGAPHDCFAALSAWYQEAKARRKARRAVIAKICKRTVKRVGAWGGKGWRKGKEGGSRA